MKKFIVISIFSLLFSCQKEGQLPDQIIGTGEIIGDALVYQTLITHEMSAKEHIIKSASENVFNLKVSFDEGKTYDTIDFNKYTLLGKYSDGQCKVVFERNVFKNIPEKKYKYNIKVHQTGDCEVHYESMNWVLVPKVEEGYSVDFKVE